MLRQKNYHNALIGVVSFYWIDLLCVGVNCMYMSWESTSWFNPLRAKFVRGNLNIYLDFMSFLHMDITQVVEIIPQIRQGPACSTKSIPWLLMSWRHKEPGHYLPWYWPSQTEITRFNVANAHNYVRSQKIRLGLKDCQISLLHIHFAD